MRKNVQKRAVIFALTLVFALVISGAASACPRGVGPGSHFQKCCCNDGWNDGWNSGCWNCNDNWGYWNHGWNRGYVNPRWYPRYRFHPMNRGIRF